MKKLLAFALLFLSSCAAPRYAEISSIGDFRKYSEQGFIITPATTGFEYEPISIIQIDVYSGYRNFRIVENSNKKKIHDDLYGANNMRQRGDRWIEPTFDDLTAIIVDKAKSMGANGILNFKTTRLTEYYKGAPVPIREGMPRHYVVSGFAVKIRK